MLYQFQVYSKVIQLYIYIYLFFFKFFSHLGYYRILSRVPCAMQQVLVITFILFSFYLFIYFLAALGLRCCARAFSLVAASRGYSSLRCAGFSLQWLLLLRRTGSRRTTTEPSCCAVVKACRLSSCGMQALECAGFSSFGTWTQQLWHTGLVAPRHVGSSQTRDQTRVQIGRAHV